LSTADRINNKTSKNLNPNRNNSIPLEYLLKIFKNPFPNIKYNYTSQKEIENIIKSLKPTSSHRYEEISVQILKASSHLISSLLTYICNKSLSTGIFPSRLKYLVIKPLFEIGDYV
jgi:hypothetical protein